MVSPEAGKLLEPTQLSGQEECNLSRILQCDGADISVNSDESSDISVNSEYLPYSNSNLPDNTAPEAENNDNTLPEEEDSDDNTQKEQENCDDHPIEVIVGNRRSGWKNVGNLLSYE